MVRESDAPYVPVDGGTLIGRVWADSEIEGPLVVSALCGNVYDITNLTPTVSYLLNQEDRLSIARNVSAERFLCTVDELVANSMSSPRQRPYFLAPCDLQAVKASGVTFVVSLFERVIEERTGGDLRKAMQMRKDISTAIGADLASVRPGSPDAEKLKSELQSKGMWSQYLEVGIGPDAEIFTKTQPLASVGLGAEIGIHPDSNWNNPEPEIVLAIDRRGNACGASIGNDVNLRDFEGRSALLLGRAKDNNASSAIGPFIRLFDESFTMDDVRSSSVRLQIEGLDGFHMEGSSEMSQISRDPLDLIAQTINDNHQYPDGLMLYLGTMFAPTQDRSGSGLGFTHKEGDVVRVSVEKLGCLENIVRRTNALAPWDFGIWELFQYLGRKGMVFPKSAVA